MVKRLSLLELNSNCRIMIYLLISFPGIFAYQLKVCHKLSTKLKREVILGSTSLDDPPQFITVSHTNTSHSKIWQTMIYESPFQSK